MLKYLATIIFLVLSFICSGQEYSYKHYSIPEGLPQTQITNLFQDSKGFIWVGTKGGVARFDGYEFENFTINEGLTTNYISQISEDSKGNIWILTPLGINLYNGREIIPYMVNDSIDINETSEFVHDNDGNIWISSKQSKYDFIHFKDGVYSDATSIIDLPGESNVQQLLYDNKKNQLWIATEEHDIYFVHEDKITKYKDRHFNNVVLVKDKQNGLYFFDYQDLFSLENGENIELLKGKHRHSGKYNLLDFDKKGIIYFRKGRSVLSEINKNEIISFPKEFNNIKAFLIDNENNLWIGTDSGLYRLLSRAFKNFTPEMGTPEYTWSILEDRNGYIWFASYGYGLGCYNGTSITQNTDYLRFSKEKTIRFYTGSIVDSEGDLQFASNIGILKYDGGKFSINKDLKESILDIFEDTLTNTKLYASRQGLTIENENNKHIIIDKKPGNTTGYIKTIGMDKFGRYWIGNEYGLSIIDADNITDYPNEEEKYSAGAVSIHRDYKGNMWIGTTSGLYYYDYKGFRKVADNILNSFVVSFMPVDTNNLLFGTSTGIGILDLDTFYSSGEEKIRWYNKDNGFMGIECIRNGMFKDSKGNIWIAASNQVVKLDPSKLNKQNTLEPQTYIQNISTLDDEMRWKNLLTVSTAKTDTIFRLPYFTKDLRFNFHAISHTAPERVRYQYQLAGYDKKWSEVTSERYVSYTNLPPGDYQFQVKACNNDGIWNKEPTVIKFSIIPAYWQTKGFFVGANLLFLLIVISLILLYIRKKRKKEKQKEEIEKQLTELQLKTIKNQVEPHFTFNVINSLGSVIFKEKKEVAYDYLTKFSRLIRTTLETSDQIGRSLEEEINFVIDYLDLQKFRFKNKFDYKINVHNEINQNMEIPKMILQTHVENAIKHGLLHKDKDGEISIEVSKDTSEIRLMILDNGVGRKRAAELNKDSTQKGLKIIDQFYSHINKFNKSKITQEIIDLYNKNGKPSGTKVIVRIPIDFNMKI